jgi:hypothetical protein
MAVDRQTGCGHGDLLHRLIVEVADLRRDVAEREAMCDGHRLVAQQAIHYCHAQHGETERLKAQNRRLHDEIRRMRLAGAIAA